LLLGTDRLWIANDANQGLVGAIVTTISNKPPQQRNAFKRADRAAMKSLIIHLAGEYRLLSWIDSAVERIQRYARQNNCRMLFISCRRGWHKWMYHRWYSREWEAVAIGRDRPTASKCKRLAARNKPGYFRLMVPVPAEKFDRYMYGFMSTCYFKAPSKEAA
jgi:hypothetical protein